MHGELVDAWARGVGAWRGERSGENECVRSASEKRPLARAREREPRVEAHRTRPRDM